MLLWRPPNRNCTNGFARIEDVISQGELESIAKSFWVAAGLDPELVNNGPSFGARR
jgi:hypothetical protein